MRETNKYPIDNFVQPIQKFMNQETFILPVMKDFTALGVNDFTRKGNLLTESARIMTRHLNSSMNPIIFLK